MSATRLVRRFAGGDAGRCGEVINACVPIMGGLNAAARAFIIGKNTTERLGEELGRCFTLVVEEAGRLEGLGVLDGDEIRRVYVHPRAHGLGIGTRIVRALEAEARRRDRSRLVLSASPSSVRFYERLGYRGAAAETTRTGDAEFVHVAMTRWMETIELRGRSAGEQVITFDRVDAGVVGVSEREREILLESIELLPGFRGIGIGTAVVRRVCEQADRTGRAVRALVGHPARRILERLGFVLAVETANQVEMVRPGTRT